MASKAGSIALAELSALMFWPTLCVFGLLKGKNKKGWVHPTLFIFPL